MNKKQQEIIDNLTREFNKLGTKPSKSFNLVNIQPLMKKTAAIKQIRLEEELSHSAWVEAARIEARRIVELLSDDLPTLKVSVWGAWNTTIRLEKPGRDPINIYIEIQRKEIKDEELDTYYKNYTGLYYSNYVTPNKSFESTSIEDILSHHLFLENLRKLL
jgi:hypothetical protein